MKRALKIIGIILVVLIVVAVALPFLINVNIFRPKLEADLSSALGRQVKVANLKFSLFSGSLAAENISIADDPGFSQSPFVQAKTLTVGVELMPLILSKTLRVTDLTLDQPQISLLRNPAGKWNFSSLGSSQAKSGPAPKPGTQSGAKAPAGKQAAAGNVSGESVAPNLSVSKLSVSSGRVLVGTVPATSKSRGYDKVNVTVRGFSFTSRFPFTLTASLPGGGDLKVEGQAGPIDANDAALTPLQAKVTVKHLDLAASGFVEPSSGVAGLVDFEGTLKSNGQVLRTSGAATADKLKLSPKGSPAGRPVTVKYTLDHNLQQESGTLSQGEVDMGKAVAHLTGTYQMPGETTLVNMKLLGQNMPVDELESMLPALGVILPSGSSLKGGTLTADLGITGPTDKLVITGHIRLAGTKLAGFDLGSKLSAVSALSGTKTGSDTSIQNLSSDVRVAPEGIQTNNVNLVIPALGQMTGNGSISPAGALSYKMLAKLTGGAVTGIAQMAGFGSKSGTDIPFFIQGTTSNPSFVPDVQGILRNQINSQLKSNIPGNTPGKSAIDSLTGLFGKKKKK